MITHCPTSYQEALVMHQERRVTETQGAFYAARIAYRDDPTCEDTEQRMLEAHAAYQKAESTLDNLRMMKAAT